MSTTMESVNKENELARGLGYTGVACMNYRKLLLLEGFQNVTKRSRRDVAVIRAVP